MPQLTGQFREAAVRAIEQCEVCMRAKHTRDPFPLLQRRSENLFDLIHADVWGPYSQESVSNTRFVLTLVEDHSRTIWTYLLSSKDLVCSVITSFIHMVRKEIKFFRTDNGTEFLNNKVHALFTQFGIIHQKTCIYTPQQNGVVERRYRTLLEAARSMMF